MFILNVNTPLIMPGLSFEKLLSFAEKPLGKWNEPAIPDWVWYFCVLYTGEKQKQDWNRCYIAVSEQKAKNLQETPYDWLRFAEGVHE